MGHVWSSLDAAAPNTSEGTHYNRRSARPIEVGGGGGLAPDAAEPVAADTSRHSQPQYINPTNHWSATH